MCAQSKVLCNFPLDEDVLHAASFHCLVLSWKITEFFKHTKSAWKRWFLEFLNLENVFNYSHCSHFVSQHWTLHGFMATWATSQFCCATFGKTSQNITLKNFKQMPGKFNPIQIQQLFLKNRHNFYFVWIKTIRWLTTKNNWC